MYFKKFPFALQTIFSLDNLEADNFFSANYRLPTIFFMKKVTPRIKNNGLSLIFSRSLKESSAIPALLFAYGVQLLYFSYVKFVSVIFDNRFTFNPLVRAYSCYTYFSVKLLQISLVAMVTVYS